MRRFLPAAVVVLGVALVVAGVVVFAVANRSGSPLDFGWTAYAPLEPGVADQSEVFLSFEDRWTVLWSGVHLVGAVLVVVGVLLLTGVAGWLLGRRSAARA